MKEFLIGKIALILINTFLRRFCDSSIFNIQLLLKFCLPRWVNIGDIASIISQNYDADSPITRFSEERIPHVS